MLPLNSRTHFEGPFLTPMNPAIPPESTSMGLSYRTTDTLDNGDHCVFLYKWLAVTCCGIHTHTLKRCTCQGSCLWDWIIFYGIHSANDYTVWQSDWLTEAISLSFHHFTLFPSLPLPSLSLSLSLSISVSLSLSLSQWKVPRGGGYIAPACGSVHWEAIAQYGVSQR